MRNTRSCAVTAAAGRMVETSRSRYSNRYPGRRAPVSTERVEG